MGDAAEAEERQECQDQESSSHHKAKRLVARSRLNGKNLYQWHETNMLNLSNFEFGDVFNVAVTGFGLSIICILVNDAVKVPSLELSGNSHNTASTVLGDD